MANVLVTGCAGFIGSHLVEKLLSQGHYVIGVDCFTDYYSKTLKERNMRGFIKDKNFLFIQKDITDLRCDDPVFRVLKQIEVIYHIAAQAGVRACWGDNFRNYTLHTFESAQKILELAKELKPRQVVYASSSSVYGNETELPLSDSSAKDKWPISPYGVTKLAGEKLCYLYHTNYGIPVVCLRYFTVFGPRQRPEMAFPKFIKSIECGEPVIVYGTGNDMTRDYTYVSDIVDGTVAAGESSLKFEIINLGGGNRSTILTALKIIEKELEKKAVVKTVPIPEGDVMHTYADTSKAKKLLNWVPKVKLAEGLKKQVAWYKELIKEGFEYE